MSAATVATVGAAIAIVTELAQALESVSGIVAGASAQNRTTLTQAEWSAVLAQADRARQRAKTALGQSFAGG